MLIVVPKKTRTSVRYEKVIPEGVIPKNHFVVLRDSNEGHRIPFPPTMRWAQPHGKWNAPSVLLTIGQKNTNLGRMETSCGDYALQGYVHVSAIERKGKMSELWSNWKTGKLEYQLTNLKRLVKYPYLLLDIPLYELYGTGGNSGFREQDPTPVVLDRVMLICNKIGVPIIGPVTAKGVRTRMILGEYLVRLLLSHIKGEKYVEFIPHSRRGKNRTKWGQFTGR